jgi:hypothetical protein
VHQTIESPTTPNRRFNGSSATDDGKVAARASHSANRYLQLPARSKQLVTVDVVHQVASDALATA